MIQVILEFIYQSEYAPMLTFGFFGLNCLVAAWYRYVWYRRQQRLPHTLAFSIFLLLLGVACTAGGLAISDRSLTDFDWLMPVAQVAWLLMQVALIVATALLVKKLDRLEKG
jgi:hypothetical protein